MSDAFALERLQRRAQTLTGFGLAGRERDWTSLPGLRPWGTSGEGAPHGTRLLCGAIANDRQSAFSSAVCVCNGLSRASAIHETAENKMKI